MFAYSDFEDRTRMNDVANFDALNKLLPAVLLILSILLLRCRVNGKKSKEVFAREKIIAFHVVIFLSLVTVYATNIILYSYYVSSPEGSIKYCRFFVA